MPLTQQPHHGPLRANKQASGMQKAQPGRRAPRLDASPTPACCVGSVALPCVPANIKSPAGCLPVPTEPSPRGRRSQQPNGLTLDHCAQINCPLECKKPNRVKAGLFATTCSGSPTWTRTRDLRINSPSLYQLSYQGKEAELYTSKFLMSSFNLHGQQNTPPGNKPWQVAASVCAAPRKIVE